MEVGVWTNAESAGGAATKVGSGTIDVAGIGPTPQVFEGTVHVSGVITRNVVIQLTPSFLNDDGTLAFYDSADFPSRFEIPVGEPPPAPDLPTSGPVPPPSAGASGLDLASVPTRSPTPADVAAGTARCTAPSEPNEAPVAALSASPTSGEEDLAVTFDGSASNDPDGPGDLASWTLDYGDGSTPSSGTGAPPASQMHVYFDPGTYTATLSVVDSAGASDSAAVTITVTESSGGSNAAPLAKLAASPKSGKAPLQVRFDGSRSADPNGSADLASWSLDFGDRTAPASGTGQPPGNIVHVYRAKGSFAPTLTVTDTAGNTDTDSVTLKVK
jgi:PKD repeat protein